MEATLFRSKVPALSSTAVVTVSLFKCTVTVSQNHDSKGGEGDIQNDREAAMSVQMSLSARGVSQQNVAVIKRPGGASTIRGSVARWPPARWGDSHSV